MQTYGIYAVNIRGITVKDDKDNGWVADLKLQFSRAARTERLLTLDHIAVVKGAARDGGQIKLEVTPMLDGEPLPSVYLPLTLRGNIAIDQESAVTCTGRVTFDMLETSGLGVDALLASSNCLECQVSNQPTLDEQVREELAQPDAPIEGQESLFDHGAPPAPAPANVTLTPREPGEDLPFPVDGDSNLNA